MKKKISLDQIKPGSLFTADALLDADSLFVPANVPVRQRDIDALKRWGVTAVFTEAPPQGHGHADRCQPPTDCLQKASCMRRPWPRRMAIENCPSTVAPDPPYALPAGSANATKMDSVAHGQQRQ